MQISLPKLRWFSDWQPRQDTKHLAVIETEQEMPPQLYFSLFYGKAQRKLLIFQ